MTFERPEILALTPWVAAALALLVLLQWRRGARLVRAWGGREPAWRLLGRDLSRLPWLRVLVLASAGAGLALAASGPAPAEPEEPPPPTPVDLIVAVDVSLSMTAADVEGSRIGQARSLLERIVEEGAADRFALAIFADWPYVLVPLTDDGDVITFFSPWVAPELVGTRDQGTSLPAVVGQARRVWEARRREDARAVVLVVTDGEAHGTEAELLDSVRVAADAGMEIWTAGVGTTGGAPIFLPGSDGAPLLHDGSPVVSGYDRGLLETMARDGRGLFHDISSDAGIGSLIDDLRGGLTGGDAPGDAPPDAAFWLVLAAFALLTLEAGLDAGVFGRKRIRPAAEEPARETRPRTRSAHARGRRAA